MRDYMREGYLEGTCGRALGNRFKRAVKVFFFMESLFSLLGKGRMMGEEGLPSLARERQSLMEAEEGLRNNPRVPYKGSYRDRKEIKAIRRETIKQNPVAYAIVYVAEKLGLEIR